MGAASDDLLDAGENGMDRRRRERQEADVKSKLSFDRSGARYNIDKSSSIDARVSVGTEEGKIKLKRIGMEYRKEF